eukprot:m.58190 g.58190  ORF g.58190 m.58190 type:complete len:601 (-) comp11160_c0_seq4:30-1832(-)
MIRGTLFAALTLISVLQTCDAYCNGMHWPPRTSDAFPSGWNNLTRTPARGWRSWYAYYTQMNQGMIQTVIDALVAKNRTVKGWDDKVSLCDLGYCSAGIDEGWEGCGLGVNNTQHYLNGTPAINPNLFPDMKGLVDYGHSKGVKMGWYFNGCGCMERREPASGWDINYEGDIRALHDFGFDAVKFDGCGRMCNMTFYAQLMQESGKAYEIENCHWGSCTGDDASSCPTITWCPFNWYRTSGDSDNNLGTWYNNLQTTVRFQTWSQPMSRPGCWAYPDMLQVGRLGCSFKTHGCPVPPNLVNWTKTHFAAFSIVSSPLILSIHPSDENLTPLLDIIGNKDAIMINQAWAGHPGTLLQTLPPSQPPAPPVQPGNHVVGVTCNNSDTTQQKWTYDATTGHIMQQGLCASSQGQDVPIVLLQCGNKSTYQNFTHDPKTNQFHIMAPAGSSKLYPECLSVAGQTAGAANKVDVYKCSTGRLQDFVIDTTTGTISTQDICLAGRASGTPPPSGVAGVQWWAKPLGPGKVAALFINGGGYNYHNANITLQQLNITTTFSSTSVKGGKVTVTDVWSGESDTVDSNGVWLTGDVPPMSSRFVIFQQSTA